MTLYVSDQDRPLDVSERLHGHPRLGQAGNPLADLDGVAVIDVSDLPPHSASGHLYHRNDAVVGADMRALLIGGSDAAARANLRPLGDGAWALIPAP
jgi:esterase/lipase superfamily enzyme